MLRQRVPLSSLDLEPSRCVDFKSLTLNVDQVADALFAEVRQIGQWAQDLRRDIPGYLEDRDMVVELKQRVRKLQQENQLICVQLDKHKIINERYKKAVRFNMSQSPLRAASKSPTQKPKRAKKEGLAKALDRSRTAQGFLEGPSFDRSMRSQESQHSDTFQAQKQSFDQRKNKRLKLKNRSLIKENVRPASPVKPLPATHARQASALELDSRQALSIFDPPSYSQQSKPIEVYRARSQLNNTTNDEHLHSYRLNQRLAEDPYEHTDQYRPPLAQTHQFNVYTETKPSSEGYIQEPSIQTRSRQNSPLQPVQRLAEQRWETEAMDERTRDIVNLPLQVPLRRPMNEMVLLQDQLYHSAIHPVDLSKQAPLPLDSQPVRVQPALPSFASAPNIHLFDHNFTSFTQSDKVSKPKPKKSKSKDKLAKKNKGKRNS